MERPQCSQICQFSHRSTALAAPCTISAGNQLELGLIFAISVYGNLLLVIRRGNYIFTISEDWKDPRLHSQGTLLKKYANLLMCIQPSPYFVSEEGFSLILHLLCTYLFWTMIYIRNWSVIYLRSRWGSKQVSKIWWNSSDHLLEYKILT